MAVPPNRMTAYQNARAAAQPAPSTSILDLGPDAFVSALNELGLQGEERSFLEQQYFAKNRALPMTPRPEGKRIGMVAPIAFPEGMTGGEALMSGNFEVTAPEFIRGMYEAPAEAVNVAGAAARGVPVTQQQMQDASQGFAEVMTGVGPARAATRVAAGGRSAAEELMDASTVSMSGARGMGDNGGPAMAPQRYINPKTGLYSPSYEAAKALPQEVGTAQQMRSMLLKNGAKEEELVYSGFDDWLKGKDKVTKQEIQDILGSVAAGQDGNMPYVRVSNAAGAGATGTSGGTNINRLRRDAIARREAELAEERNNTLMSAVQDLGYRPLQFTDENDFRSITNQVRESYNNRKNEYFDQDYNPLPRKEVRDALFEADLMMDTFGLPFDSPQVQSVLQPLSKRDNIGVQRFISPSGRIEDSTSIFIRMRDQLRGSDGDEAPDDLQLREAPFFDTVPNARRVQVHDEFSEMPIDRLAGYLGLDPATIVQGFDPGRTMYPKYVVPGMRNYSENQYMFDDTGRGVLSGIESLGVSPYSQKHFSAGNNPMMFFTLTGELNTPEGPAYNLATIQSDIGQDYRKNPDRFFVPGSTSTTAEPSRLRSKQAALPFATSTNRWLDAALRNELVNAAKSSAEWITIPKGADVQRYTYGDVEGQEGFYGGPDKRGVAPTRLQNVARGLLPFDLEFKDIEAKGFGPNPKAYNVFGLRLTPEIREFILEGGLPSFAKGGPVNGSILDVDVFAFP